MCLNVSEDIHHKQRDFVLDVSRTLQKNYNSNELLSLMDSGGIS